MKNDTDEMQHKLSVVGNQSVFVGKTELQESAILSSDYQSAKDALDNAVLKNDIKTIRLGLKNRINTIQQATVKALAKLKDKDSVPNLIECLKSNQGVFSGGTETEIMQRDLNISIIFALSTITELTFDASKSPTSDEIEKVITESQNWLNIKKKK
jgi:hypothetical protein